MFKKIKFFFYYQCPVLFVSAILVGLDWLIKNWIQYGIVYGEGVNVCPGLRVVHWHNHGMSFGLLNRAAGWQNLVLIGVSVTAMLSFLIWFFRLPLRAHGARWALGLILAGAAGNLMDRIMQGYVVDYILIYYQSWYWPVFNLADALITVGVMYFIYQQLFAKKS